MNKRQQIIAGLRAQNDPAEHNGKRGFWVQADCTFVRADTPGGAIRTYRDAVATDRVAISHNLFCDGIRLVQLQETEPSRTADQRDAELACIRRERDAFRRETETLRQKRDELLERQQEHLRLIQRLTTEAVSPDEAAELRAQVAALVAKVGTLRAQLAKASGATR